MGDIICRNCGEPWDRYGAQHGDMKASEYKMLISGKGCPSCKGEPVYDCVKFKGIYIPYSQLKQECEYLEFGQRCSNEGECEFKKRRPRVDDIEFLESVDANTDGSEALDAAMDIEFEERRKQVGL